MARSFAHRGFLSSCLCQRLPLGGRAACLHQLAGEEAGELDEPERIAEGAGECVPRGGAKGGVGEVVDRLHRPDAPQRVRLPRAPGEERERKATHGKGRNTLSATIFPNKCS